MTLENRVARLEEDTEANAETRRIVTVLEERLLGEKLIDFDVTGDRRQGALDKLDLLFHASMNGGVPARLSDEERSARDRQTRLIIGAVTAAATVIVAALGVIAAVVT